MSKSDLYMPNNRLKNVIIILVLLIVIILISIVAIISKKDEQASVEKKIYRQVVGMDKGEKAKDISFITCYKNDFLIKKSSDSTCKMDCYVGNSSDNIYDNMYFELYIKSNNQLIYKSGTIPRGKYVDSVGIEDTNLVPGKYEGELVHYILTDDGELVRKVFVVVSIVVE